MGANSYCCEPDTYARGLGDGAFILLGKPQPEFVQEPCRRGRSQPRGRKLLELLAERYAAQGLPSEEAKRAARLKFDGSEQLKEKVRDVRIGSFIDTTFQDLRYGCRTLQ